MRLTLTPVNTTPFASTVGSISTRTSVSGVSTCGLTVTCERLTAAVPMASMPTMTWLSSRSSVAGAYLVGRGTGHVDIQGLFVPAASAPKFASEQAAANKQARSNKASNNKAANAAAKRSLDRTGPPGG
jgi:hypothetical protein